VEILTTTGYSKKNYGAWMNQVMSSSPSEWVLFHDHDIFLANKNWFSLLLRAIEKEPQAGLFSCMTNRIGNPAQKAPGADRLTNDLAYHIKFAEDFERRDLLKEATRPVSGLMMLTSRTAWNDCGGFRERGIIGVDNAYYGAIKRAGYKVYIINNLYVYHRYRYQPK
jgi:GT2 family glycosyltransferase